MGYEENLYFTWFLFVLLPWYPGHTHMMIFFFGWKRFPFFLHQVNDDAAQTIHHSQSHLILLHHRFPALTLSPTAFFHPSSIITLSFLSCLSKQIAGRLLLPLWPHFETLIWIPSPSAHPLHHHSCVLPPLTQSFLTCLYVYDPMQLGEQPLWVVVFFFFSSPPILHLQWSAQLWSLA